MDIIITETVIREFEKHLVEDEKSPATREKYLRSVRDFFEFLSGKALTKEEVLEYKNKLIEDGYSDRSINAALAGLNSLLDYLNVRDCRVKNMKIQKQVYLSEEKELTRAEYMKLLAAAEGNKKLHMIMETICGTGIRVSELKFFTTESVESGEVHIRLKGKARVILISGKLRKKLLDYAKSEDINDGIIFRNTKGEAMDRSVIWSLMKGLCEAAGVTSTKVFPHNLRKLFARCFYKIEKDIAKLADILGHSSIDTTRIYIMTSGREHRRIINQLDLVV